MPSRRQWLGLLGGLTGCVGRPKRGSPSPESAETSSPGSVTTSERDGDPGPAAWHRPRHDPGQSGYAPGGTLPDDANVAWSIDVYGNRTAPVVTAKAVYLAHAYGLFRFDRTTGERRWTSELHGDEDVPTPTDWTTTHTPTPYHTERVPRVFRWPSLVDGRLVVGFGPWVLRVDPENGQIAGAVKRTGLGPAHPVVSGDAVYLTFDDWVVATDQSGRENRWTTSPGDVASPGNETTLQRPVVVAGDRLVVADDADEASIYALDAENGEQRWQTTVGSSPLAVAARDGVVYAASRDGTVTARNAADGAERWTAEVAGPVERVVVTDQTLYCGGTSEQLHGLDLQTGSSRFTRHGRPLAAGRDGVVVAGSGSVRGVATDGTQKWSYSATGHEAAVLDGTVFLTVEDRLVALA